MEIFDVCDELGIPTGETVERETAHREGIRHRTAHVWIVRQKDGRDEVLLQKRSMNKDSFPGQLDTSSAGHIPAGQEPAISAVRELEEELGIHAGTEELEYIGQFRVQYDKSFHGRPFRDNEIAHVYLLGKEPELSEVVVQEEEIECVGWYDLKETIEACRRGDPAYCIPPGGLNVLCRRLGYPEFVKDGAGSGQDR